MFKCDLICLAIHWNPWNMVISTCASNQAEMSQFLCSILNFNEKKNGSAFILAYHIDFSGAHRTNTHTWQNTMQEICLPSFGSILFRVNPLTKSGCSSNDWRGSPQYISNRKLFDEKTTQMCHKSCFHFQKEKQKSAKYLLAFVEHRADEIELRHSSSSTLDN